MQRQYMSKIEHLRIRMISEINILIEVLSYYKHNCKNKIILEENIDGLLSKCAEVQHKMLNNE